MSSVISEKVYVDPRVIRTRKVLGEALTEVLSEKNFQSVSVQDITDKAGVNRTTFYLHFSDKFALLDYNINQMFKQELETRMLSVCRYSPENMTSLIITVAEFIVFSMSHCESRPNDTQFEGLVETSVKLQLQQIIQVWGQSDSFPSDPKTISIAASWAIFGLALEWFHDRKRPPVTEFARSITPVIDSILGIRKRI